ncbi:MAG: hypothetical protein FD168_824 [Desulfobulbaceae bacterium]|nr:MAG: hypothetical protein FD168_824 [Desulfobulbaceae bacterium]
MEEIVCRHDWSLFSGGRRRIAEVRCTETVGRLGSLLVLKFRGGSKWRDEKEKMT